MDITKLCRSCMKEVASWEKENFDNRAVEMFCYCTNIEITEEDKLPKQFCYDCIIKIESSYTFIKEAQNVNVTLKNVVSRTETSIIVELENHSMQPDINIIPKCHLKLTLPDYKLSSTIECSTKEVTYNHIDIDSLKKEIPNSINTVDVANSNPTEELHNVEDLPNATGTNETDKKNVESVKKNVCPICRKEFTSKIWFSKHMGKEHSGHKYSCVHCPKTFSKPSQLAYHAASHSEERKFACSACNKRFKRRKQLIAHTKAHSEERPYACDKCNKRFKFKSILKCHLKVHEQDKPYLCSYCGWSFAQAGNLAVHVRIHTGAKPHACGVCGFRTAAASSLRRHVRRHRAPPPLVCTHCSKRFYDASGLVRHTRTHTGELPYRCPGCTRAFSDSWKRKTHLMRAHRLALQDIPPMRRDGEPVKST